MRRREDREGEASTTDATTAPQPTRFSPLRTAARPHASDAATSTADGTGVRTSNGGGASERPATIAPGDAAPSRGSGALRSCVRHQSGRRSRSRARLRRRLRRVRGAARARMITSAPTTSRMTRPWMMYVRFWPATGRRPPGRGCASTCPAAARRTAAPRRTVPTAVLRPSSATAMPRKPSEPTWMSFVAMRNCQPRTSIAPGQAGEQPAERHDPDVVAPDADAAVARRLRVEADGARLVAARRAVEQTPKRTARGERDEEADVQALQLGVAPEDVQAGVRRRRRWRPGRRAARRSAAARPG